jgi:hypothetical protein
VLLLLLLLLTQRCAGDYILLQITHRMHCTESWVPEGPPSTEASCKQQQTNMCNTRGHAHSIMESNDQRRIRSCLAQHSMRTAACHVAVGQPVCCWLLTKKILHQPVVEVTASQNPAPCCNLRSDRPRSQQLHMLFDHILREPLRTS